MDIEYFRKELGTEGVAFPRIGVTLESTGDPTMGRRPILSSSGSQAVFEEGYQRFMTSEGVAAEQADLQPRQQVAIRFINEVKWIPSSRHQKC